MKSGSSARYRTFGRSVTKSRYTGAPIRKKKKMPRAAQNFSSVFVTFTFLICNSHIQKVSVVPCSTLYLLLHERKKTLLSAYKGKRKQF